jgi:hypothetical protein
MTMTEASVSERPLARYGLLMAVCVIAGGIAGGVSAAFGETAGAGPLIVAGSVGLAMAAGLWVCARWWRALDEAAQEAHKWAWWWGSTFGLAIGGVALFTLAYATPDALTAAPKDLLLGGAGILALGQTVGYGIAWAFWWLQRR